MARKQSADQLHNEIVKAFKNAGLIIIEENLSDEMDAYARDTADQVLYEGNTYLNEQGITDQGILQSSGVVEPNDGGGYDVVWYAEHAEWINYGTDPHSVSPEGVKNIEDWVRRKLRPETKPGESKEAAVKRVANAIVWQVRKQGMEPKPFADVATETVVSQRSR